MNRVLKITVRAGAAIFLLAAIMNCNPTRKIIKEPIKDKKADFLFSQLKKNEFKFDWLSIKFSATVSNGKTENSFEGNIRMRKDSIIWVSIQAPLGIQIARALITQDSVKLINKIDETYMAGGFATLTDLIKTDLDFDMIQSLIVGNDFSFYETDIFKSSVDGMLYKLSTVGRGKIKKYLKTSQDSLNLLTQDIWLDPETYKITKVHLKEPKENRKLEAEYSDFAKVDSLLYPNKLHFNASTEKEKIEISIENFKVSATGPLEFPFNVSSKYKKVEP